MEYNELMQGFAAKFAVEGLEIDDGISILDIDGVTFVFIDNNASKTIIIMVELGKPTPEMDQNITSRMLKANYLFNDMEGATFCQIPENDGYAIQQSFPIANLNPDILTEHVERLLEFANVWKEKVAGKLDADDFQDDNAEEQSEDQEDNDDKINPLFGGFMRV